MTPNDECSGMRTINRWDVVVKKELLTSISTRYLYRLQQAALHILFFSISHIALQQDRRIIILFCFFLSFLDSVFLLFFRRREISHVSVTTAIAKALKFPVSQIHVIQRATLCGVDKHTSNQSDMELKKFMFLFCWLKWIFWVHSTFFLFLINDEMQIDTEKTNGLLYLWCKGGGRF